MENCEREMHFKIRVLLNESAQLILAQLGDYQSNAVCFQWICCLAYQTVADALLCRRP